jgi:hypothetical protein
MNKFLHIELLQGLCGTFNGKRGDDLTTSEGDITLNLQTFVDSWRVSPMCNDKPEFSHPCERDANRAQRAADICNVLKQPPFQGNIASFNSQTYDMSVKMLQFVSISRQFVKQFSLF